MRIKATKYYLLEAKITFSKDLHRLVKGPALYITYKVSINVAFTNFNQILKIYLKYFFFLFFFLICIIRLKVTIICRTKLPCMYLYTMPYMLSALSYILHFCLLIITYTLKKKCSTFFSFSLTLSP